MPEDYRDDMLLDEMAENDLEMAKDAVKNCQRYRFNNPLAAKRLHFVAIDATLKRVGLNVLEDFSPTAIQGNLDRLNVQIEDRQNYKGEDIWRNGLYIYKNGEIVAFISSILHEKPSPFAINRKDNYIIYTNANLSHRYISGKVPTSGFDARVIAPGSPN